MVTFCHRIQCTDALGSSFSSIQLDKKLPRTTPAVIRIVFCHTPTLHYGLELKFTAQHQRINQSCKHTHKRTLIWKQALAFHCKLMNVMRFLVLVLMIWSYHSMLEHFIDSAQEHLVFFTSPHLKSTENHQALQIMSISLNQVGLLISFPLPHNAIFDFSCCV